MRKTRLVSLFAIASSGAFIAFGTAANSDDRTNIPRQVATQIVALARLDSNAELWFDYILKTQGEQAKTAVLANSAYSESDKQILISDIERMPAFIKSRINVASAVRPTIVQFLTNNYTPAELEGIRKFYQTSAGAKYGERYANITIKSQEAFQERIQDRLGNAFDQARMEARQRGLLPNRGL
ncbi:MAG: DUF2059 domain-containing protein [Candidatus Melainabacteria bacterium]|nr:DUF2059 domain-containing protein [Candidatus Melainabacteria bacterium]